MADQAHDRLSPYIYKNPVYTRTQTHVDVEEFRSDGFARGSLPLKSKNNGIVSLLSLSLSSLAFRSIVQFRESRVDIKGER